MSLMSELPGDQYGPDAFQRGMVLDIYRCTARPDCSNSGVSAAADHVTVTGVVELLGPEHPAPVPVPPECRVFAPTLTRPEALLVVRKFSGGILLHVVPKPKPGELVGRFMMGGCYVGTSDSRWSRLMDFLQGHPFYGALALHDRVE
jgi:hypothetical protein